jgi:hypothetical protein
MLRGIAKKAMHLARAPAGWNHPAEKDSRQINLLEHVPTANPLHTFGGTCSKHEGCSVI